MPRVKLFDETEVLEKAMHLFWKKGYFATSIQDLVNHLGINRASLYDTYGGKKTLFKKAFSHYRKSNSNLMKNFLDSQADVREGFRALFKTALQQSLHDQDNKGCMVVNTTVEFIPNENEFADLINENKKQFEELFYQYLSKGVKTGQVSKEKDLRSIAALMFTYYNGLKVVTKADFNPKIFGKSVDTLLSVLD